MHVPGKITLGPTETKVCAHPYNCKLIYFWGLLYHAFAAITTHPSYACFCLQEWALLPDCAFTYVTYLHAPHRVCQRLHVLTLAKRTYWREPSCQRLKSFSLAIFTQPLGDLYIAKGCYSEYKLKPPWVLYLNHLLRRVVGLSSQWFILHSENC